MRIAIANFSAPIQKTLPFQSFWSDHVLPPPRRRRMSLFEQRLDWGFHIYALGVYLLDKQVASAVEFWDYAEQRATRYHSNGVLRVWFWNEADVSAYLERYGYPDLFINHGPHGETLLPLLEGKCFRVHVPALRSAASRHGNFGAECYLVDAEEHLDDRSMLYIPVVNTRKIFPASCRKERDFIYLAKASGGKRHDVLLDAVRGTDLSGHLHPVDAAALDLRDTKVTTSNWDESDVLHLLRSSRIAVYPGDRTSNPAAMWECVAAGLPIVMNQQIEGGKHLVVPGVTGELAAPGDFRETMRYVLRHHQQYHPRQYFDVHWDTVTLLDQYLSFFRAMGWRP